MLDALGHLMFLWRGVRHRRFVRTLVVGLVLLAAPVAAIAQRFLFDDFRRDPPVKNIPYDGRFTFARLRYTTGPGGYYYRGLPAWAHGYWLAERNLMNILNEISFLGPHVQEGNVLALDDPELCKYPVAYMTEAGFWTMSDKEVEAFRSYLQKGGFVIFDDFRGPGRIPWGGGWENFETLMQRVIPGARLIDLEASHPIFHSFFEIDSFAIVPQAYDSGRPVFRGLFEDNDRNKRLMAIVNFDTDVSQFWEFSGTGFRPVEESNEAYKLGVNYIVYGMTH